MTDSTHGFFEILGKILLRCWILGFLLLMIWFGVFMLAPIVIYSLHGEMFDLTRSQLNIIHYCGMGITKLIVSLFFFLPWMSIRMVLNIAQ